MFRIKNLNNTKLGILDEIDEKKNKTFMIAKKIENQNTEMKSLIEKKFENPDNYLDIDNEVIIGKYRIN